MYLKYFVKSRLKILEKKNFFANFFLLFFGENNFRYVKDFTKRGRILLFLLTFENLSKKKEKKSRLVELY